MRWTRSAAAVIALAVVAGCASSTHKAAGPQPVVTTQAWRVVSYDGVELRVPPTWPIIDGAHATYRCGSTFEGQSDRVFVGPTYFRTPECPRLGQVPGTDGVWIQKGGAPWRPTSHVLNGQTVQIQTLQGMSVVTAWLHGVSIQIGIGRDPGVEQAILNSISYRPTARNTPVRERCPKPSPEPPVMPTPTRLKTNLPSLDGSAAMTPAPAAIRPAVKASTVWKRFFADQGATSFPGSLIWTISFGIDPSQGSIPIWAIEARPARTAYGPCGITMLAKYNASDGQSLGLMEVG